MTWCLPPPAASPRIHRSPPARQPCVGRLCTQLEMAASSPSSPACQKLAQSTTFAPTATTGDTMSSSAANQVNMKLPGPPPVPVHAPAPTLPARPQPPAPRHPLPPPTPPLLTLKDRVASVAAPSKAKSFIVATGDTSHAAPTSPTECSDCGRRALPSTDPPCLPVRGEDGGRACVHACLRNS